MDASTIAEENQRIQLAYDRYQLAMTKLIDLGNSSGNSSMKNWINSDCPVFKANNPVFDQFFKEEYNKDDHSLLCKTLECIVEMEKNYAIYTDSKGNHNEAEDNVLSAAYARNLLVHIKHVDNSGSDDGKASVEDALKFAKAVYEEIISNLPREEKVEPSLQ